MTVPWNHELMRENEAAWQRLEHVSGLSRERWQQLDDPEVARLLGEYPAVRAALDEVQRSIRDVLVWGAARADVAMAEIESQRQQIRNEHPD